MPPHVEPRFEKANQVTGPSLSTKSAWSRDVDGPRRQASGIQALDNDDIGSRGDECARRIGISAQWDGPRPMIVANSTRHKISPGREAPGRNQIIYEPRDAYDIEFDKWTWDLTAALRASLMDIVKKARCQMGRA
jgi:hypothetical protein